jgi:hypothetical protein
MHISCLQVEAFEEAGLPRPLAFIAAELIVHAEEMYGHLLSLREGVGLPRRDSITMLIEHIEPLPRKLTEILVTADAEVAEPRLDRRELAL